MGDEQSTRLLRTPKEGERILAPTRRPDGTFRKSIRIRPGYTPPDEVPKYQSKGALVNIRTGYLFLPFLSLKLNHSLFSSLFCCVLQMRKAAESLVPPGYDPQLDGKLKTKSVKRNERKKEKKLQAALVTADKGKNLNLEEAVERTSEEDSADLYDRVDAVNSVAEGINNLSISLLARTTESSKTGDCSGVDIDKRIRALKKKIRLAEGQLKVDQQDLKPEQIEKIAKIEGWQEELKMWEDKRSISIQAFH